MKLLRRFLMNVVKAFFTLLICVVITGAFVTALFGIVWALTCVMPLKFGAVAVFTLLATLLLGAAFTMEEPPNE